MRNTHLARSWELWIAVLLCFGLATSVVFGADQDGQQGVKLRLKNVPFKAVVTTIAQENGMKLVIQPDIKVDDTLVSPDFPNPTPPEKIIAGIAAPLGLDFWKSGDTYYIGKLKSVDATPAAVVDPLPTLTVPMTGNSAAATVRPAALSTTDETTSTAKPVIRRLDLQHTSVKELMFLLQVPGYESIDRQRARELTTRFQTALDPRHPREVSVDMQNDNSSSAASAPWLSGVLGTVSRHDSTSADQFLPGGFPGTPGATPGGIAPPSGFPGVGNPATPGFPGAPGAAPGAAPGGNPLNPNGANGNAAGSLKDFMPKGIQQILGLSGLNAILVKAETEDDIDSLAQLIKLFDQPIKQVIVEVMFVDMKVKDAMSIGASLEYGGMPLSMVSLNGGDTGNFTMHYIKGNIRAALGALLSKTSNKVVNAPRVIVRNEQSAQIMMTNSLPFVVVNETQDVFGRTIQTPQIDLQTFQQGLTVNYVTIHPDDSVTLNVVPQLSAPTSISVPIPGGSGSIAGNTDAQVSTILRVRNGETVMMGGFISRNEITSGTRTPLLSNIPVLGPLLFGMQSHSTDNSETMIFITPTIMKEDSTDFGGMATLPPLF